MHRRIIVSALIGSRSAAGAETGAGAGVSGGGPTIGG